MPKQRSPNRDKAKEIYLQANGDIPIIDIAKQLGETDGTVRGWKAKDKWDVVFKSNGTLQTKGTKTAKGTERPTDAEKRSKRSSKKNVPKNTCQKSKNEKSDTNYSETETSKRMGPPFGNKNAVGGKGGHGGPFKNKKALKTGEYETIFWTADILDD